MDLSRIYPWIRPLLFRLAPEQAHTVTLALLSQAQKINLIQAKPDQPALKKTVMGLDFVNPIGLSAGLDKDGICIAGLAALGFGFLEVGTVTPRAQAGNAKPRLFRLKHAEALVNRLGFNNLGVDALVNNILKCKIYRQNNPFILGVNLGKNATTSLEHAIVDYLYGMRAVYKYCDYIAVNISSPNTTDLRNLQTGRYFEALLCALKKEQMRLSQIFKLYRPIAIKIAPDLTDLELEEISRLSLLHEIDGIIVSNTTNQSPLLQRVLAPGQTGGLSGRPLLAGANRALSKIVEFTEKKLAIIGVGGILDPQDALEKIRIGADLVQLYTGLIYRGPQLIKNIKKALSPPGDLTMQVG
jgi:dihydroorotate dehydrogenase